jgi:hypothetical protein
MAVIVYSSLNDTFNLPTVSILNMQKTMRDISCKTKPREIFPNSTNKTIKVDRS